MRQRASLVCIAVLASTLGASAQATDPLMASGDVWLPREDRSASDPQPDRAPAPAARDDIVDPKAIATGDVWPAESAPGPQLDLAQSSKLRAAPMRE